MGVSRDGHRTAESMFRATLCFPIDGDRVLLIEKKRGPGAGLYNAPGGKIEPGETPQESAIRETREETGISVHALGKCGELRFVFGDDPFSFVHVFRATGFEGPPRETDEARPEWFDRDALPYDRMWDGDRYWVPRVLDDEPFEGTVWFDDGGDEVEEYELRGASF